MAPPGLTHLTYRNVKLNDSTRGWPLLRLLTAASYYRCKRKESKQHDMHTCRHIFPNPPFS